MREVWRAIPDDIIGYEVSSKGRVRRAGKVLRPWKDRKGYFYISIHNGIKRNKRHKSVHRLVAGAFIPLDAERYYVNHKDGDPANNNVENLEWCTRSENMLHAARVLHRIPGRPEGNPTLTPELVRQIRAILADARWPDCRAIGRAHGVTEGAVYGIRDRRTWAKLP